MAVVPTVLGVLAGICAYAALTHLSSGIRSPRSVTELLFGAMCTVVAVYSLIGIPIYRAETVDAYVESVRLSATLGQLFHVLLLWFTARYTRVRPWPLLIALTLAHVGLIVANLFRPYGFAFDDVSELAVKALPWGESLVTPVATGGSWLLAAYAVVLLDLAFVFYACVVHFRRGHRRSASMLGLSVALFVAVIPIDMLIHSGAINFMFVAEFGFLAPIVVMSVNLSREARDALESSNRELYDEITERIRTEEALDRSRERIRITLNSIGDAVFTTDEQGTIAGMNPAAEQLVRTTEEQARGRRFADLARLLARQTREPIGDLALEALEAGTAVFDTSHAILQLLDGTERRVASSSAPIRDRGGAVVGAVLVFRDVTEYRRLEQQLQHSRKLDAIGRLAGGVAHDFNNLLTGMIGYAELLEEGLAGNERLQHHARVLMESGMRAADLTRKLLAFGRSTPSVVSALQVHTVIDDVVEMLRRSIDKRIEITCSLDAVDDTVLGDASQLHSALLNLGINARDAMPDGGTLSFSTRVVERGAVELDADGHELQPGRYLEIRVSDTGCGIPEAILDQVFEPYFTTKELGAGTGLGLAAVYGTLQEHRGAISVDTAPGRGSSFELLLPLARSARRSERTPGSSPARQASDRGLILVIDDELSVRTVTGEILEHLGFAVMLACDGEEGLALFSEHAERIDAVILDMVMPGLGGSEVFHRLRAVRDDLSVLVSSGYTADDRLDELLRQSHVDLLAKPFRKLDVDRKLNGLLDAAARPRGTVPR